MKAIEEKIWDELSGLATRAEREELQQLLASHPEYRKLYQEIEALHAKLKSMELEEPSMAFQRRVMDAIAPLPVPGSFSAVDHRIIRGIALFFILGIAALLITLIYLTDWNSGGTNVRMPEIRWNIQFNKPTLYGFMFMDMILGLYLLDEFLRKKRQSGIF